MSILGPNISAILSNSLLRPVYKISVLAYRQVYHVKFNDIIIFVLVQGKYQRHTESRIRR